MRCLPFDEESKEWLFLYLKYVFLKKRVSVSKKLHICIDGLNLALSKGTGIATYARNLGNFLHQADCKLSILFDKNINEKVSDLLYETLFYEAINQPSEKERRPRESAMHYLLIPFYFFKSLCYLIRTPRVKEHAFNGVVQNEEMKKRLPSFDTIYNSRNLYRLAQCYFMIYGRLLPITLNPTPDVMHWTCPIPARVVGAKNYYTIHDLIPLRLPYTTKDNKKFFYDMMLRIVKSADKLITVSEYSRQDIINYLPVMQEKVINTYQNVSVPLLNSNEEGLFTENQLKGSFDLTPNSYFLFVGAIEPNKNVVRLVEAFLSANVRQKLVIAGPLAWQSEREKALLKRYCSRVLYLNYVTNEALSALMRHARALIFPSLYEGFGLPVIEAMAMGLPVITSNQSSLPEIASDAAYLVNPYEVREIAKAIHQLATDDALCAKLSEKGKKRAEYFSHALYAERLKAVYAL